MRRALLSLLAFTLAASTALAQNPAVQPQDVRVPAKSNVPAPQSLKKAFPAGFPLGVGSGLAFLRKEKDGALLFYAVTDRGPNTDSPRWLAGSDPRGESAKIFPAPGFHPSLALLRVKGGKADLQRLAPLKSQDGKPVTGLPPAKGQAGSTGEIPLDAALKPLPFDENGLDPEGVAVDQPRGSLWIADEYGPFLAEFDDRTFTLKRKLGPGAGLPSILAKRQPNRGFEGVCVTPSGKIVAAVQSILDTDGKVKDSQASFTRLVEFDPSTARARMLAYPLDTHAYRRTADAKIGDVAALSDTLFLVLEQGEGRDKALRTMLYLVDISTASSLPDLPLETTGMQGMTLARKWLVADLRGLGWSPEKAEGLALVDERTFALICDNDFGLTAEISAPATTKDGRTAAKPDDYTVGQDGTLHLEGKPVASRVILAPNGEKTKLWIVTMPKPFTDYIVK
ncbi:hypothetical protein NNJEOMEG_00963 [Fundidesulfovibrio magnetotacticus]|uniref:Phytase-like domain-containing protein n=1 Tax=Fundidesulfovibrio magnetotacticus TaxID=2730080 RepID=A0A6V8LKA1_9BACT|nr:esterase-like activity of phytase family protein [Fundidesulfovibrio magnetotacticus]GFK93133.1 hypothetical protein NNJEOMEG_00963 [Fundidesulfovibrio magnetotacticus]